MVMKLNIILDSTRSFWALIYLLNDKRFDDNEYELREKFKSIKISKELKKEIKKIIFTGSEISNPILDEIKANNLNLWKDYWIKNKDKLEKVKVGLLDEIAKYDFTAFEKYENFFGKKLSKTITVLLCTGAISNHGSGLAHYSDNVALFPRAFSNPTKSTMQKDFNVLIHELVHLMQENIKNSEDSNFLESLTCLFAPKGILTNCQQDNPATRIINSAIAQGKKYSDVRLELIKALSVKDQSSS